MEVNCINNHNNPPYIDIATHLIGRNVHDHLNDMIEYLDVRITLLDRNDTNYNEKYQKAQDLLLILSSFRQLLSTTYSKQALINMYKNRNNIAIH